MYGSRQHPPPRPSELSLRAHYKVRVVCNWWGAGNARESPRARGACGATRKLDPWAGRAGRPQQWHANPAVSQHSSSNRNFTKYSASERRCPRGAAPTAAAVLAAPDAAPSLASGSLRSPVGPTKIPETPAQKDNRVSGAGGGHARRARTDTQVANPTPRRQGTAPIYTQQTPDKVKLSLLEKPPNPKMTPGGGRPAPHALPVAPVCPTRHLIIITNLFLM
jgi:hypothetical protein